eukprot:1405377-Pyramimonas_sp.AAC.1
MGPNKTYLDVARPPSRDPLSGDRLPGGLAPLGFCILILIVIGLFSDGPEIRLGFQAEQSTISTARSKSGIRSGGLIALCQQFDTHPYPMYYGTPTKDSWYYDTPRLSLCSKYIIFCLGLDGVNIDYVVM